MKIILIPLFKYTFSIFIGLIVLFCTLCFYPIVVIWELKFMSWGEYIAYNHVWGTEYQEDKVLERLEKENFFDTMKRWINFEYAIFLRPDND